MLLDDIRVVLVNRETRGDSGLHVGAHLKLVDVDARLCFHLEWCGLSQRGEVLDGLRVDGVGVWIGVGWQVNLRPRHVQEAQRIAGSQCLRLLGIDNIVGNSRHGRRGWGRGSKCAEGKEMSHEKRKLYLLDFDRFWRLETQ
jgi:hypothetical protein